MDRPDYCPCGNDEPPVCPACGATIEPGPNDTCRARHNGPPPTAYLDLVLIDKRSNEVVASVSAYH